MIEAQGMSQGQDVSSSPAVAPQPAQSAEMPHEPAVTNEKIFKQSEVNDIVKKAKYGAVEDYKRLQTQQPNYAQQKSNDAIETYRNQQTPHFDSEHHIRQLAAEEAQRLRDQWVQDAQTKAETDQAQRTVQNFFDKMAAGKEKYQDFETVMQNVDMRAFPNVVQILAEHVDNAHDLMHYLGNDAIKMNELENLAYRSPKSAILHAKRLSQSMKDNEAASKVKLPNEPLNQMRPSNIGTDNGVMGVGDYRRKWKV